MRTDFLSQYLDYTADTETPKFFNRWACLSMLGAYLGREASFKLGHFDIYPNMYCMLIGSPGTRKSTAIKTAKSILSQVGYDTFSAEKTTKEKFLLDLSGEEADDTAKEDILEQNLFGTAPSGAAEMYIAADEFNDYIGNGNIEFISLLGSLWDFKGTYTNRIKNGKSVSICNPTINIFGGNTPVGFALAFPPDIIGQGFFSRILLIYGEPTGKRITFPRIPSEETTRTLLTALQSIKASVQGDITLHKSAEELLDHIYQNWKGLDDVRFESYSNRRFTHLLKLCMLCAACRASTLVDRSDVIYANTILSHTEHLMPKALGEFGKAKHSDVSHRILQVLESTDKPVPMQELYERISGSTSLKYVEMSDLIQDMVRGKKMQFAGGGFLPVKKVVQEHDSSTVDFKLLTPEERIYYE